MEGVRVMGIDAQCSVQVLWQYFDDKGGVVKAIYYPLLNNDAVIIFKHPTGTTDVLSRNHEKWKVSPLPNQVFSRQRVWVESDLSMLVQATEAYQDSLRNMGQVDFIIDSNTHELILTGQPYQVYMDDITKIKTDAVVNAANWELKNLGGVAGALARAAGPEMAAECCKLLQKHGALATAQVVKTKAYGKLGHLKCVIHTVGPIYIETDTERSVFELTQTFYNCLEFAEKLHLTSIAFPFISTGIFGMPVELCVLSLVSAVMLFSEQQRGTGSPVEEIHFINNDINVVCEAIIMIEQRLSMETMDSTRQRFEEGKKHYGRYVFPSYQSTSFQRSDSERYATWDSSQQRYAVDREDMDISQPGGRSDSHLLTGTGSLTQFGAKLDLRQRSGSLDRGCKTLPLDSISQRTAGSHPSPRPQARPRSNSMTLRGKTPSASSRASASSLTFHGGDCGRQPVIKKSLTGSSSKSTGLAKKVANKKSAQSAGEHLSSDTS
ncbi:uncharacterized protein LOC143297329 isoform X2 [Babylonia areolata]|uniref:uncharacterized protein LOC143297329 isoform X2 n=1 Tax=Babylonia areolata TaxID=304850 RepID=UPI003FD2A194